MSAKVGTQLLGVAKECQALIAYVCLETLTTRGSMTSNQQEELVFEMFHGSKAKPEMLVQIDQFVSGEGRYACLFEEQDSSDIGSMKKLRKELTRDMSTTYYVLQRGMEADDAANKKIITVELLERKFPNSDTKISGRTLKNKADLVLANCKVATSIGQSMFDSNNLLPSGKDSEDFFVHVLLGMFKKLTLEPKCNDLASSEDRDKVMSAKLKPDWIFPGYMVFVAFGPLALDEDSKSNLMKHGKFHCPFLFVA